MTEQFNTNEQATGWNALNPRNLVLGFNWQLPNLRFQPYNDRSRLYSDCFFRKSHHTFDVSKHSQLVFQKNLETSKEKLNIYSRLLKSRELKKYFINYLLA